jgi:hypothetical protein
MSYYQNYYHQAQITSLASGINVHLHCPVCNYQWTANYSLGSSFPDPYDFNQLIMFAIPVHTSLITGNQCILPYNNVKVCLAVHNDSTHGLFIQVQRGNISLVAANWWQSGSSQG